MTYQASRETDCQPSLLLVKSWEETIDDKKPKPTILATSGEASVIEDSLENIAKELRAAADQLPRHTLDSHLVAVLDKRSATSDDGLIVIAEGDKVYCVRVHFDTINSELIRINVITASLDHSKILAREQPDSVLRSRPQEPRQHGRPVPRKKLGA